MLLMTYLSLMRKCKRNNTSAARLIATVAYRRKTEALAPTAEKAVTYK